MKFSHQNKSTPGFFRRMGAITYDSLLLFGVLFLTTALVLPFNSGEAFAPGHWSYSIFLFLVSFLFFAWFWTHGGQTLGMRAWKIKVQNGESKPISWKQAVTRYLAAILSWGAGGIGFMWILFNRNHLAWHDLISKTKIAWDDRID